MPFEKGSAKMRLLLGGKGANLAEMTNLGVPVPYGFTITTDCCNKFYNEAEEKIWNELKNQIFDNIKELEKKSGKKFGGNTNPLLVSVRSGASVSMPGMMDTILNLGLNYETVEALASASNNERFAWDSFRRFVQMYGNVVMGVSLHSFENQITKLKEDNNFSEDTEISAKLWKELIADFLDIIKKESGKEFPMNPNDQLLGAVEAVFTSWNAERAIFYRSINSIPHDIGTAVNIQMMVFGNLGETSGTGVCFTRDPSTGENIFYGEYLLNAQGEDVVAGIRTPHQIITLKADLPKIYAELIALRKNLEKHFKDMQDIEFTIENEKLFVLQTRTGKRSASASVKIATDMVKENVLTKKEALHRVTDKDIETLLHPRLDEKEKASKIALCKGLPASPGGATGKIVFTSEDAIEGAKHEEKTILVRHETSPEDISGMHAAAGILTACGGMTSHAAVVARGMGRPCVSGVSEIKIDESRGVIQIDDLLLKKGDIITIDGATGEVFNGRISKLPANIAGPFQQILEWAKDEKTLEVRTNADTPKDVAKAIDLGAEGIGLCRTEHMFFAKERILEVRKMILSEDKETQQKALTEIQNFQKTDFIEIYKILEDKPICIRLLDPPLHEFLPHADNEIEELAQIMKKSPQNLRERIEHLNEVNPMMGHRGCRLLLTISSLLEAQVHAILSAAKETKKENVEIMIPLIATLGEFTTLKKRIQEVAKEYSDVNFKIGTMIETPRACLRSQDIQNHAEFFSFGTNDLTQMTFGFSRDDMGKFLPEYLRQAILQNDPFQVVDTAGVGELMRNVLSTLPANFKTSVCGEHGGEGKSIKFFNEIGIKTVSCSPFRVPVAIVAAGRCA